MKKLSLILCSVAIICLINVANIHAGSRTKSNKPVGDMVIDPDYDDDGIIDGEDDRPYIIFNIALWCLLY